MSTGEKKNDAIYKDEFKCIKCHEYLYPLGNIFIIKYSHH
jgi:hypothetical protein